LQQVPVIHRETLRDGATLRGPALIVDSTGTFVLEEGFRLEVRGQLLVAHGEDSARLPEVSTTPTDRPDPVRLEVMSHHFMSIAEQMGRVLQRTSLSTNIRERFDFSCAVFDPEGRLIANAPHIPVHLGAMG